VVNFSPSKRCISVHSYNHSKINIIYIFSSPSFTPQIRRRTVRNISITCWPSSSVCFVCCSYTSICFDYFYFIVISTSVCIYFFNFNNNTIDSCSYWDSKSIVCCLKIMRNIIRTFKLSICIHIITHLCIIRITPRHSSYCCVVCHCAW